MFQKLKVWLVTKYEAWRDKVIAKERERLFAAIKKAILEQFSEDDQKLVAVLVDNQLNHMRANGTLTKAQRDAKPFDGTETAILAMLPNVIKRQLALRSIVGVQPMTGPTDLAYLMGIKPQSDDDKAAKRIAMQVISLPATAKTRQLQAKWSMEAVMDAAAIHPGLDLEAELAYVLAEEVGMETFLDVLAKIRSLASINHTVQFLKPSFEDSVTGLAGARLALEINKAANDIGRVTRRGTGNFVITSPIVVAYLQSAPGSKFVAASETDRGPLSHSLMFMGTINETIKVYSSIYAEDEIIIGYNGKSTSDTGLVYAPYVPVMASGITVDAETFQPMVRLMTRFDYLITDGTHPQLTHKSSDYFRRIQLIQASPAPEVGVVDQQTNS